VSRNGSAGLDPVIDHHPRQQQPSRIAAHLVDASAFPGPAADGGLRHDTGELVGAPRVGFVVGAQPYLAGEAQPRDR